LATCLRNTVLKKICFGMFLIFEIFLIKNLWIFDNVFLNFTTMKFCTKKNGRWWQVEHDGLNVTQS
jgi:hypothetical protein